MVRTLADKYMNSDSQEVKKQAGKQIEQTLHMHSRLEEPVFYPAVRCIDESLIGHFGQHHQKVDDLLAMLDGMSLDAARSDGLISAVTTPIQEEENDLFARIEGSGVDMTPVGLQMQACEANMVHMQAQRCGAELATGWLPGGRCAENLAACRPRGRVFRQAVVQLHPAQAAAHEGVVAWGHLLRVVEAGAGDTELFRPAGILESERGAAQRAESA